MAVLYIDRKDLEVRAEGNHLCLYESGVRRSTVPMHLLERVVMRGNVHLTSGVLTLLAENDVGLLALSGRHGRGVAMLLGRPAGDTNRRIAQYRWCHDENYRLPWSLALVRSKLLSQRKLLLHALTTRPDCRTVLLDGAGKLDKALEGLRAYENLAGKEDSLRGVEGSAANVYFHAYTQLFPSSLEFTGRNRRPPRDPVNAVLSLGYTMLYFEAVTACHIAGLDPCVGFFHEPAHNRESLAADLIEPLRAHIDEWVWRLFADRKLRGDGFSREENACLLGKAGRQTFYAEYEIFARPLRRLLRRLALAAAKLLLEGGSP